MRIPSAIYPFSSQLLPIVNKFDELQSIYSLKAIFSPAGLGLIGHDAGYACNKRNTDMVISGEEEIDASHWNAFHVFRPHNGMLLGSSYFVKIIERAVNKGKSVIYYDIERCSISQEIMKLHDRYRDNFTIQVNNKNKYDNFETQEGLEKIKAPVILVGGLLECQDILGVLLCLTIKFINIGLHPAVVTKQPIGQLFGFHNINHIFSSPNSTEASKIREINRYLAMIENYDFPDVIIVEAPDAVMKYNDTDPNGFGILTYMLAQAIQPDILVCCIPVQLACVAFIKSLSGDLLIRLGTPIHAVQVSNIIVDSMDLLNSNKLSSSHLTL